MPTEYENLPREALIKLPKRRDSQTPYGLFESGNGLHPTRP